jgi:uncharacterized coiled-coil protein SlyX
MDPTIGSIITAVVAAVSAIIVSVVNNNAQIVKIRDEQRETFNKFSAETGKAMALTDERLRNLTDEVKKHNSIVERMYKVEQSQAIFEKELEELRNDVRQVGA